MFACDTHDACYYIRSITLAAQTCAAAGGWRLTLVRVFERRFKCQGRPIVRWLTDRVAADLELRAGAAQHEAVVRPMYNAVARVPM